MKNSLSEKEFILLMAVLMSVVAISIDALLPSLGVIGKYFKIQDVNQTQYIISAIFAGMAVGQLISGSLSDAYGRRAVLFITLAVYALGSVICLFATSLNMMLVGRVVQGLGVSGPYISCMSIVRDKYSGRVMAKIMSLIMTIFICVPIFAPALGQLILSVASWQFIFGFYIFYAASVSLWIYLRLEETLAPENRVTFNLKNMIHGFREVFSSRNTMLYTICMGLVFGCLIGDLNSARQIFQEQFGVGKMFVVYFGLQALVFGFSSYANSKLVEKYGMHYLCEYGLKIIAVISALFLIAHLLIEIKFWMFFLFGAVLLFCVGLLFGNLNALSLEPMGHIAGLASAIIGSFSSIISIFLGTIIGQLYNGTLVPLLSGFLLFSVTGYILMVLTEKQK